MTKQLIEAIAKSGIEFKYTAKGKKTAWYYSYKAARKFRLKLAEAEMLIATGQAEQVKELI
jgi:hypothetical protein